MDTEDENIEEYCLRCTEVPISLLKKAEAKEYFSRFGQIVRVNLKPKIKTCLVEYLSDEGLEYALLNAGNYNGQTFSVSKIPKPIVKKITRHTDPDWIPDAEVQAELDAMSTVGKYQLRTYEPIAKKEKGLKRIWTSPSIQKNKRTSDQISTNFLPADQRELMNTIKQQVHTIEDKFKVLDVRDKLIRLRTQRSTDIADAKHTVGTCPDMCPEKERLMREVQHQVALYEQEPLSKTMDACLAVKQYSRSSADQEAPLPHELRNVAVLQMTMGYLMHKIMNMCDSPDTNLGEWYHFLWDRTRGIRKDITQQELCCQGSVQLVEQCARFHIHCSARLVAEDPSVFDHKINTENLTKCLQTLKYMYHDLSVKNESCPNEAEFRAYIILLNLNDGNFMWELQQLRSEIQKSKEVQFALEVYSALDKNNYVKFFKLVRSTTYLNACILLRYFIQVRVNALRCIIKGYSPRLLHTHYPLDELKGILGFEGIASTRDFSEYYGLRMSESARHVVLTRKNFVLPKLPYSLDRATNVVESKRSGLVGEIVCGGPLPPKLYESHVPNTSFDQNGFLNLKEIFGDLDFSSLPKDQEEKEDVKSELHRNVFSLRKSESRSNSPMDMVDSESRNLWSKPREPLAETQKIQFGQTNQENIFAQKRDNASEERDESCEQPKPIEKRSQNVFGQGNQIVFGQGNQNVGQKTLGQRYPYLLFGPKNKEIFNQGRPERGFNQRSQEPFATSNIFGQKHQTMSVGQNQENALGQSSQDSLFSQGSNEGSYENVFAQKPQTEQRSNDNIFGPRRSINIFPHKYDTIFESANNATQKQKEISQSKLQSIFGSKPATIPFKPEPSQQQSIFGNQNFGTSKPTQQVFGNKPETLRPQQKTGGFYFALKSTSNPKYEEQIKRIGEERKQLEIRQIEMKQRLEEKMREIEARKEHAKQLELERQRQLEHQKLLEERKLEEQRLEERRLEEIRLQEKLREEIRLEELRLEEERRKREIEIQRKLDEERRRQLELQRIEEIKNEVTAILTDLVNDVEEKCKQDKLASIRQKILQRKMREMIKKWKTNVVIRKRKRKSIDEWPIWINTTTSREEARQLSQPTQTDVLMDLKRYKSGNPTTLRLTDHLISKNVNFKAIILSLLKRFNESNWKKNQIYWKILISLPTIAESRSNLRKIEEHVSDIFQWNAVTNSPIKTLKLSGKKVTYCFKKHDKFYKDESSDGYIFINDAFTEEFFNNVRKVLENSKALPLVPIAIILSEARYDSEKLDHLIEDDLISNYEVYVSSFTQLRLEGAIKNALIYLAKNVSQPPPLELDTLRNFVSKYLATETWERISSFARSNRPYALCLTNPRIAFSLYEEALSRLEELVLNKNMLSYKDFPKVFDDVEQPDYLPCDYRYFPSFWRNESYKQKIKRIFHQLRIPNFNVNWPPKDETHLEEVVCKISSTFEKPEKMFYTLTSVILRKLEQLADFSDVRFMMWTDIIEILTLEKINEIDFTLREPFSSIFDELFVVYNADDLANLKTSLWFFDNLAVQKVMDSSGHVVEESEGEEEVEETVNLEKTFNDATAYDGEREEKISKGKRELHDLEMLMNDLEESMQIGKKICDRFQKSLTIVLDDR